MELQTVSKLTIIAGAMLCDRLADDLKHHGIESFTISGVQGNAARRLCTADFEGEQIKIEAIATPEQAEKFLAHLNHTYTKEYSIVAYIEQAKALKPKRP